MLAGKIRRIAPALGRTLYVFVVTHQSSLTAEPTDTRAVDNAND